MKKLFLIATVIFHSFSLLGATTWDGSESSDWNDPDNWTAGVPDSDDDVTIPDCTALPNCPVIDGTTSADTKKLTVDQNATLIVQGGGSLSSADKVEIDGAFTVDPGATFSAADDVEVGKNNDNAIFTNDGTTNLSKKLKAEGGGTMPSGPYIVNSGTMSGATEINIGNGDGGGTLTNTGTGVISTDKLHVDGTLNNQGIMNAGTELKVHGGTIDGGGTINTPLVEFDDNGGRDGIFGAQAISDGSGCSGSTSGGVTYEVKGTGFSGTFQELIDQPAPDGGDNGTEYEFSDPGSFSSCGESAASALPVELISFYGQFLNTGINLSWSTASEIDNDYFIIEKSTDGKEFTKIAEVSGNGTTNRVSNYSFTDYSISGFQNFYRLRQVDFDGQFEYFNTILIETTENAAGISIFPNPSKNGRLHVNVKHDFGSSPIQVQLYDIFGRTIQIQQGLNKHFEFSTIHLKRGTYFVKVSVDNFVSNNKVLVD
ncbi:MAG: T9SS type A sorting domain-containing protein [Cyclobacteriaceae bacterium]